MTLYHGSFLEIAKPDLVHSRPNVDFGRGFYVTPLYEQAAKWCGKFKRRGKDGIISRYEYDESRETELKTLPRNGWFLFWIAAVGKIRRIMTLLWVVLPMIRCSIRWNCFLTG